MCFQYLLLGGHTRIGMYVRRCVGSICLALVFGCATTTQYVDLPGDNEELTEGRVSRIVVTRTNELVGAMNATTILDGEREIGSIRAGGRLYWDREPGLVSLQTKDMYGVGTAPYLINAEGGLIYYVGLSPTSGFYPLHSENTRRHIAESPPASPERLPIESHGTGFSISSDGIIVTAFHVIRSAIEQDAHIRVRFHTDDEWRSATVRSYSRLNDLAIRSLTTEVE